VSPLKIKIPSKNMREKPTNTPTKSMEKQTGMAFGFRKTATAVIEPDR
jgi:hypothetical protein